LQNLKTFLQNKLVVVAAIGLGLGVAFGLVYGYLINPVEWTDTSMEAARVELQEDYLRMAIDSYRLYGNKLLAITRWQELGAAAPKTLEKIKYAPGDLGWEAVLAFEQTVTIINNAPGSAESESTTAGNNNLCIFLWSMTTLLVIGLAVFFYGRTQPIASRPQLKVSQIFPMWEARRTAHPVSLKEEEEIEEAFQSEQAQFLKNPPLVNYIWTYAMGDDQFEETHSIDTAAGDFLGECGIEIVKTMDSGKPKKVTAFDIWLFDKNEINTRSIILMSHNAYENDILRAQFEMKGKPTLAEIGKEIEVKTDNLLMRMRVLDMICAQVEGGKCEYFQRLSLDVNIWQE
jgi:hypothetical protein